MELTEIPDYQFYQPVFSPWLGFGEFVRFYARAHEHTLVSPDRCYVLYTLALQALHLGGEFWECGVYKGGTAAMLAEIIARLRRGKKRNRRLRLFDTFAGIPVADPDKDLHNIGDFNDTSVTAVKALVGHDKLVSYHVGRIPETFRGREFARIAFAHVDVDVYDSVVACCKFIFPRLMAGGFMIFDDYGFPSCPGARSAVDEYFRQTGAVPLVLSTGQAVVFKSRRSPADWLRWWEMLRRK